MQKYLAQRIFAPAEKVSFAQHFLFQATKFPRCNIFYFWKQFFNSAKKFPWCNIFSHWQKSFSLATLFLQGNIFSLGKETADLQCIWHFQRTSSFYNRWEKVTAHIFFSNILTADPKYCYIIYIKVFKVASDITNASDRLTIYYIFAWRNCKLQFFLIYINSDPFLLLGLLSTYINSKPKILLKKLLI